MLCIQIQVSPIRATNVEERAYRRQQEPLAAGLLRSRRHENVIDTPSLIQAKRSPAQVIDVNGSRES
jgi:hypothetical protein